MRVSVHSLVVVALLLTLPCCSSGPRSQDLTAATEHRTDFAPEDGREREIPFSAVREGDVLFAMNLKEELDEDAALYWIRILVRNEGKTAFEGAIKVEAQDAAGVQVPAVTKDLILQVALSTANQGPSGTEEAAGYAGMAGTAAGLAGAPIPGLGLLGPAASLFGSSGKRRDAPKRAQWALTHWLPDSLSLAPEEARGGILAFAATRPRPLLVTISWAGQTARFLTQ